jgi:hypothetical protein
MNTILPAVLPLDIPLYSYVEIMYGRLEGPLQSQK